MNFWQIKPQKNLDKNRIEYVVRPLERGESFSLQLKEEITMEKNRLNGIKGFF